MNMCICEICKKKYEEGTMFYSDTCDDCSKILDEAEKRLEIK